MQNKAFACFEWLILIIVVSLLALVVIAFFANQVEAQEACSGVSDIRIEGGNDASDPIRVHTPCPCVGWDTPTGVVSHYHLRLDGEIYLNTPIGGGTQYKVCLLTKDVILAVDLYAVPLIGTSPSPLSDTTYIRWEDRVCEQTIIVPPNPDGSCP